MPDVAVLGAQHRRDLPLAVWELPLLGLLAAGPRAGATLMLIRLGGSQ